MCATDRGFDGIDGLERIGPRTSRPSRRSSA